MIYDYGLQSRAGVIGIALAVLAATAIGVPTRAGAAQLDRIGLSADRQTAVLTLSLTAPVAQHVFRLYNPDRLVIDLPGTRRHASLPQPPADSVVATVRSGVRDGHSLRLVLELRAALQPQLQPTTRANGYQLRIALAAAPVPVRAAPEPAAGAMQVSADTPNTPSAPDAAQDAVPAVAAASVPAMPPRAARSVRAAHAPQGAACILRATRTFRARDGFVAVRL